MINYPMTRTEKLLIGGIFGMLGLIAWAIVVLALTVWR